MANKESLVQKKLTDAIREEFPDSYFRKIAQGRYSWGGIPDLLGCLHGRFIAIEVKTDSGRLSKLQERELNFIGIADGVGLTCHGETDIKRIINILRKL